MPNPNATIIEVLRHYSDTNPRKGKLLAEYLDYLEDCHAYEVDLMASDDCD
jgi:hypothetical protein